jgi:hypothetical protein
VVRGGLSLLFVELEGAVGFLAAWAWRECYVLAFRSFSFYLRPYRDEPSASRPIRADKHRRGQRVLTWVTSREHCAAAGFFLLLRPFNQV